MNKHKILKVSLCVAIALAVCVAGLLIASLKATTVRAEETTKQAETAAYLPPDDIVSSSAAPENLLYSDENTTYYEETEAEYVEEMTEVYIEEYVEETYTEYVESETETEYYEEPVYEEPVYEEPVYEEPVYEEPVYEEPVYEEPEPEYSWTSGIASSAAAIAEAYVGVTPYVPGGHSLDGADCSGFTYACYAAAGYYGLPFSDGGQACQGRSVLNEEWLPGDIIVYSGHVAMYVGNGMMVHSPDVGRYVEYGNPWYTTILDVRRILE